MLQHYQNLFLIKRNINGIEITRQYAKHSRLFFYIRFIFCILILYFYSIFIFHMCILYLYCIYFLHISIYHLYFCCFSKDIILNSGIQYICLIKSIVIITDKPDNFKQIVLRTIYLAYIYLYLYIYILHHI